MLTAILHRLVAHPTVYDAVQVAAGARVIERELRAALASLQLTGTVLDVGGGTGGWKQLFPASVRHVCLDLDGVKLRGFRAKFPRGLALRADATRLPFPDASVENVMCTFIAHHLSDDAYRAMVDEAARVLVPGGWFLLADPLFVASRWRGRVLWRYDRGRHPRTLAAHRAAVARRFTLEREHSFAVIHAYALLVGRKARAHASPP